MFLVIGLQSFFQTLNIQLSFIIKVCLSITRKNDFLIIELIEFCA